MISELLSSIKRNCKVYFKDKGMFFSSLITPIILLVLYVFFLSKVFKDSFVSSLGEVSCPDKLINGMVAGQLCSSLLAVCCITVAFCSNMIMVNDKVTGARNDLLITPASRWVHAIGYYVSTAVTTVIVCGVAGVGSLIYIACSGWYLSVGDVFLLLADIVLLSMFGTALSSVINFFLSTQGQMSAVGTAVSAGYGFVCGAYMPISFFGKTLQNILGFLPGTYGTSLVRLHAMNGTFREMISMGWDDSVISEIRDSVDANLYFFGNKVEIWVSYLVLILSIVLLIAVYVLLNMFCGKKKNK